MTAFRLTEKTRARLEYLAVIYGTKTAALIKAVHDLYHKEVRATGKGIEDDR